MGTDHGRFLAAAAATATLTMFVLATVAAGTTAPVSLTASAVVFGTGATGHYLTHALLAYLRERTARKET